MFVKYPLIIFCFLPAICLAQLDDAALKSMVQTERNFAITAKEKNTRDAFLYFLSDEAVTAGPYGPVIGKSELKNQKPNGSLLSWDVAFADIASSGEFGYDTGPWEFRKDKTDEQAIAFGEFHSVWQKQSDGQWKNIADIGISHGPPSSKEELTTTTRPLKSENSSTPPSRSIISLMEREKLFLADLAMKGLEVYSQYGSEELRIAREGEFPIITPTEKAKFLKQPNRYMNSRLSDGAIAASGDMGFMYGTADIVVTTDDKKETKRATYMRVWKKESKGEWKIVLDVMAYR